MRARDLLFHFFVAAGISSKPYVRRTLWHSHSWLCIGITGCSSGRPAVLPGSPTHARFASVGVAGGRPEAFVAKGFGYQATFDARQTGVTDGLSFHHSKDSLPSLHTHSRRRPS